jgi:hypothetical protein
MGNGIGIVRRIIVDDDVAARKSTKREWLDELAGSFRHCDSHVAACFLQSAQHFNGLVGSDTAADT